ncbi:hypothetical protein D7D25_16600 [Proteiniphilum sp. X52]|nr:hypothetical protein D7D25_16600 [Proteiniphilum sp. X52]
MLKVCHQGVPLTLFCDPLWLSYAKRVALAPLRTAALFMLTAGRGYPVKQLKESALVTIM